MGLNFDDTDFFCRINVQAQMPFVEFVALVARCVGGASHMNAIRAKALDISVVENDDFDADLSRVGEDRWLYFRYTLEADPSDGVLPKDYVAAIGALLNSLWSSRMDAVAACDFEEKLPRNVRRLTGFVKWFGDTQDSRGEPSMSPIPPLCPQSPTPIPSNPNNETDTVPTKPANRNYEIGISDQQTGTH